VRFDIHVHYHLDHHVEAALTTILERTETIMADTNATLAKLAAASASLDGIQQDIADLKALIAAGGTPQEIADAVDALASKAAGIDLQTP